MSNLLICTVGMNPAPVAASLIFNRPDRTLFIVSQQSKNTPFAAIARATQAAQEQGLGFTLNDGQWRSLPVESADDIESIVRRIRTEIGHEVREWLLRGGNYELTVDPTGGTVAMSVALALVTRRYRCRFSYISGPRDASGIVIDGREFAVFASNPWNALGFQVVEEAIQLFDSSDYGAAASILATAADNTSEDDVGQPLRTLASVARAFDAWDRFDHSAAQIEIGDVLKRQADLGVFLDERRARALARELRVGHGRLVELIAQNKRPGNALVEDLLANAWRRMQLGRFDDAVARLYRATEALAQARLRGTYELSTHRVPLEKLPGNLPQEWAARADQQGFLKISQLDGYRVLSGFGDQLAARFESDADLRRLLNRRNNSILAHGFEPVKAADCHQLWKKILNLAGMTEENLLQFPKLDAPTTGELGQPGESGN